MSWWQFWKQRPDAPAERAPARPGDGERVVPEGARTATRGDAQPRPRPGAGQDDESTRRRRVAELRRRLERTRFDIEQGELAQRPNNPWRERIALLDDALATVTEDRAALDALPPEPTHAVPALPVSTVTVETGEPATVRFDIGEVSFEYQEAVDWDNRGGMVVRGDLRRTAGNAGDLLDAALDAEAKAAFASQLDQNLLTFAVALRDRALEGEDIPANVDLADIMRPDPEVGGWRDWHGTNPVRVSRAYRRQQLRTDAERLERERADEEDQRRTLVDRLPIARKRLQVVEDELRALGAEPGPPGRG